MNHTPEFRAKVCALKGELTAAEIGLRYGISKNAVIGIWNRAKTPPLTEDQFFQSSSQGQKAAWQRRKARG